MEARAGAEVLKEAMVSQVAGMEKVIKVATVMEEVTKVAAVTEEVIKVEAVLEEVVKVEECMEKEVVRVVAVMEEVTKVVAGAIAVNGQEEVLQRGLVGQVGHGVAVEARVGAEVLKKVVGSQKVSQKASQMVSQKASQMVFLRAPQTEVIAGDIDMSLQAQAKVPKSLAKVGAGAIAVNGQEEVLKGDPAGQVGLGVAVEAGKGEEVLKEAMVSQMASMEKVETFKKAYQKVSMKAVKGAL